MIAAGNAAPWPGIFRKANPAREVSKRDMQREGRSSDAVKSRTHFIMLRFQQQGPRAGLPSVPRELPASAWQRCDVGRGGLAPVDAIA
jgi:hypothetical protein